MARPTYAPQLATLVSTPPEGDEWLHEVKYDGYRLGAVVDRGRVRLITRNGQDWTDVFPQIRDALTALPVRDTLLDGEVADAMKVVRCLNRLEAFILPKVVAARAVKRYPDDMNLQEKVLNGARIYAQTAVNFFKGVVRG